MKNKLWCLAALLTLFMVANLSAKDPEIVTTLKDDQLFEGSKIILEVQNLDSNNLKWEFGDGGINVGPRRITHVYRSRGMYKITVTDMTDKYPDPITQKITIIKEGREIIIENDGVFTGIPVNMRVRKFIDPSIQWNFGDGTVKTAGSSITHAYQRGGTFTVKVKDYGGRGEKTFSKTVTIREDKRKLLVPAGVLAGEPIELNLQHAEGGNYTWIFSDGQRFNGITVKRIIFRSPGRITVNIEDTSKNFPPMSGSITVAPDHRKLESSLDFALPEEDITFEAIQFRGPVKWDFGDGVKQSGGTKINHQYQRVGRFRVTAHDFNGNGQRVFSRDITVGELTPVFNINLLELAFHGGKYYRVASTKRAHPAYYLKIKAMGRGILKGQWILDGHPAELFQVLLRDGHIAELKGNDVMALPLTGQGMHTLTVEFTNYSFNQRIPIIRYFVTETGAIRILSPEYGGKVDAAKSVTLKWAFPSGIGKPDYQLLVSDTPLQFLNDDQMVWKATGSSEEYKLNTQEFKSGTWIYWQVRAMSSTGRVLTMSEIASFKIVK